MFPWSCLELAYTCKQKGLKVILNVSSTKFLIRIRFSLKKKSDQNTLIRIRYIINIAYNVLFKTHLIYKRTVQIGGFSLWWIRISFFLRIRPITTPIWFHINGQPLIKKTFFEARKKSKKMWPLICRTIRDKGQFFISNLININAPINFFRWK